MKTTFASLLCLAALCVSTLRAADATALDAVKAADEARIAAMTSATPSSLDTLLSDDLRYAHSSGAVDNKASFLESLTSGKLKYLSYQNDERAFTFPVPGIALMSGRAHVKVATPKGNLEMVLGYLGIWREEGGKWRFLAWQSNKLPMPEKAP